MRNIEGHAIDVREGEGMAGTETKEYDSILKTLKEQWPIAEIKVRALLIERDTLKAALELAKTALQYGDYSYNVSQIDADREDKTFREALDAIDTSDDKAGK